MRKPDDPYWAQSGMPARSSVSRTSDLEGVELWYLKRSLAEVLPAAVHVLEIQRHQFDPELGRTVGVHVRVREG